MKLFASGDILITGEIGGGAVVGTGGGIGGGAGG